MASTDSCCKKDLKGECVKSDGKTCRVTKQCKIQTAEGERDCECVCICACKTTDCASKCACLHDCACTEANVTKYTADDGTTKYKCERRCEC